MRANLISVARVCLLFVAVGLLYGDSVSAKLLAFIVVILVIWMDALDGHIARKYHEESELGGVLDITGDRIVENVLWICFAHQHLVSVLIPVIVITRGLVTDSIRSVALSRGMTAFGDQSMMTSSLGEFLVASRFSRGLYGALKAAAFGYILLLICLRFYLLRKGVVLTDTGYGWWLWLAKDLLAWLTVGFCVIRGLPVIKDGMRLFKPTGSAPAE